jgi:hypothetical protein
VTFKRRLLVGLLFAGLCVLALVGVVLQTIERRERA